MSNKTVQAAAARRGLRFNGKKQWINSLIGYGYFIQVPTGNILQADTLKGLYSLIMKYPRIESY